METALVLTLDRFQAIEGKTAHGMVRGPSRYQIVSLVDASCAGQDAGTLLDGRPRDIPIDASIGEALARLENVPDVCVVGVATVGGVIPPELSVLLIEAAQAGMTLINGLHHALADEPDIVQAAHAAGVEMIDFRRPRPSADLRFWTGEVLSLAAPRVPVLGTDCAIGKRTSASLLRDALTGRGIRAEMVYTGQSGYLQGFPHGFLFDATPNDFVPGELEGAVLACAREADPQVILVEGQASLRNPSGPCGPELMLSCGAQGVVLQHQPSRKHFKGFAHLDCRVPTVADEIALIAAYGVKVWAVTLNTKGLEPDEAEAERARLEQSLGIPVVLPLRDGLDRVADTLCDRLGLRSADAAGPA